jgi:small basic protein
LGGGFGLAYGLVSQWLNVVLLPNVPLYLSSFEPNLALSIYACVGVLFGGLAAWPHKFSNGLFLGSFVGALAAQALIIWQGRLDVGVNLLVAAILFLPLAGAGAAVAGPLRWLVEKQLDILWDQLSWARLSVIPLGVMVLGGVMGLTAVYPPTAQAHLTRFNTYLQNALVTYTLPNVPDFASHADLHYALTWTTDRVERFRIPYQLGESGRAAIEVRFANGWQMACVMSDQRPAPRCVALTNEP